MGSCTSKSSGPANASNQPSSQSTQAKRQQQLQTIQQKQQQQQQLLKQPGDQTQAQNQPTSNGKLKAGSTSEATKHPSTSSNTDQSQDYTSVNNNNEKQVAKDPVTAAAQSNPNKEIKVLLLGSGESGKSTIVKQMKILHSNGYTPEELEEFIPFIYKNILDCIKNVINAIIDLEPELIRKPDEVGEDETQVTGLTSENNNIATTNGGTSRQHILDYDSLNEILDYEYSLDTDEPFDPKVALKIKAVYNTPEVRTFMNKRQGEFYLIDSTSYFLSNIDRICLSQDYLPTVMDVLRTRKKTSGIFDFKFDMGNGLNIHLFDVGGQRSERKKWIHCFDNVQLIIFAVGLSEYDQVLLEENGQNRLQESLLLFESICNSRWFARTSVVLFLNKIDVFSQKLNYSPLENYFPDYSGGADLNKAVKYILYRFQQVNRSGLKIYPHVTCATDTSNIKLVMGAVKETILENSLKDIGIV
ncbi:Guanine nucleotide-binding protein alpha-3 subunit [Candida viswanathii]|uniref:Guanine nucleotide-binding protein alpha-3 subunit n=1 Tax=Candida viswanathii TaxID=5486 RepID=A0A367XWL1_9ASCO|nr:Guanine nucleotide-binding protein alpha-3 subunit [Candida viswanathii]